MGNNIDPIPNPDFIKNAPRYILQCVIAAVILCLAHLLINKISSMTVVVSLGASTYIAFSMPNDKISSPPRLVGGYLIGGICGIIFNYINYFFVLSEIDIFGHPPHIIFCAVAAGVSMLIMSIVNLPHPPGAAFAMGLVLDSSIYMTFFVAIVGIVIVALIKTVLRKWLRDF